METNIAGTPIPDHVRAQLGRISHEAMRTEIEQVFGQLEEVEAPKRPEDNNSSGRLIEDVVATRAAAEDKPVELIGDSERVRGHMSRIAETVDLVTRELTESGKTEEDATTAKIWEATARALKQNAIEAKAQGDKQKTRDALGDMLVVLELGESVNPTYKWHVGSVITEAVGDGLGLDLVEISRESNGLVVVSPPDPEDTFASRQSSVRPIDGGVESRIKLIELATGKHLSCAPEQPMIGGDLSREEGLSRLEDRGIYEAAQVIKSRTVDSETPDNLEPSTDAILEYALDSDRLVEEYRLEAPELVDAIMVFKEKVPGFASGEYDDLLSRIAVARDVGSEYRNNSESINTVDLAIFLLWEKGETEIAGKMLSLNLNETRGNNGPEDRGHMGDVSHRFYVYDIEMSDDRVTEVVDAIEKSLDQKREVLIARINSFTAGHDSQANQLLDKNKVLSQRDPEAYADLVIEKINILDELFSSEKTGPNISYAVRNAGSNTLSLVRAITDPRVASAMMSEGSEWVNGELSVPFRLERLADYLDNDTFMKIASKSDRWELAHLIEFVTNNNTPKEVVLELFESEGFTALSSLGPTAVMTTLSAFKYTTEMVGDYTIALNNPDVISMIYDDPVIAEIVIAHLTSAPADHKRIVLAFNDPSVKELTSTGYGDIVASSILNRFYEKTPDSIRQRAQSLSTVLELGNIKRISEQNPDSIRPLVEGLCGLESDANLLELGQTFNEILGQPGIGAMLENEILGPRIMSSVLEQNTSEGMRRVAGQLDLLFREPQELWKNLLVLSEITTGLKVEESANTHVVKFVPKLRLRDGIKDPSHKDFIGSVDGFELKDIALMSQRERELVLTPEALERLGDTFEEMQGYSFQDFKPDVRRQIYAYMISETISRSRDASAKAVAGHRNITIAERGKMDRLSAGDFIHAAPIDALLQILQDGNFAGESRSTTTTKTDSFPFNVDMSIIKPGESVEEQFKDSWSANYGGLDGVVLVYGRSYGAWMEGQTSTPSSADRQGVQGLVLGGIPSTEITGLILKQNTTENQVRAKESIIQNGFYIPVYDMNGELVFTPEEFGQMYEDMNMTVPVQVNYDSVLRTNEKLGSNDGSVYVISTKDGPKKHYIKFGGQRAHVDVDEDSQTKNASQMEHVWTEYLADEIYRRMGITVPETAMVKVEGRVGHDSVWIDETTVNRPVGEVTTLEGGFVVDAWLANWDIVYNQGNTLEIDGVVFRSDNGGALDLRAQGQQKPDDIWNEEVLELQIGQDNERLGLGMRQKYPNLTDEQVSEQATKLRETMTDEVIDELVDSVRRSKADREDLKTVLKARRDYIVAKVL